MTNPTVIKIISIVSLITFIIGMLFPAVAIFGSAWLLNVSDNAYYESSEPGVERLFGLGALLGGGFLGTMGVVIGICCAIYDAVAHVPALIAHIVWKKTKNATAYWILISLWLCLLFGSSIFILVF